MLSGLAARRRGALSKWKARRAPARTARNGNAKTLQRKTSRRGKCVLSSENHEFEGVTAWPAWRSPVKTGIALEGQRGRRKKTWNHNATIKEVGQKKVYIGVGADPRLAKLKRALHGVGLQECAALLDRERGAVWLWCVEITASGQKCQRVPQGLGWRDANGSDGQRGRTEPPPF